MFIGAGNRLLIGYVQTLSKDHLEFGIHNTE